MYINLTTNAPYPKTLFISNEKGGAVWQVYHVEAQHEADRLSKTATANGFEHIELKDFDEDVTESYPDWRDTTGGKKIISI
jgi:hypothetical protein